MQRSSSHRSSPSSTGEAIRLGGVRADFVTGLGQHLERLNARLRAMETSPKSSRLRDELRRQIHALEVRARVLHFPTTASRLDEAEKLLLDVALGQGVDARRLDALRALLSDLPSVAWHEVGQQQRPKRPEDSPRAADEQDQSEAIVPRVVLVIGPEALCEAFSVGAAAANAQHCECERMDVGPDAVTLAQVLAPDAILLDGDHARAKQVASSLHDDPLTTSIPLLVVGSWSMPEQAAVFVQMGVQKTLPKPLSPRSLWSHVWQMLVSDTASELPEPIGTTTIEVLADKLASEFRAGLLDAVAPESRSQLIDLSGGVEVQAAVWAAIARIRETLTLQSAGAIRFLPMGPASILPLAPWLKGPTDDTADRRLGHRENETDEPTDLHGIRVLIADDAPAVTWFLRDLLRSHGATTREAYDGKQALQEARSFHPDLIITDIIMPQLDGFALSRALKRDVLLQDVPVILLSWKQDLLERIKSMGAEADGYLRKEASSPAVLRTIREALRPKFRIERRLRSQPKTMGRLDGLTAVSLLRLVMKVKDQARITIRDARYLFDIAVRSGKIVSLTQTDEKGTIFPLEESLQTLLSVSQGRFQVEPLTEDASQTMQLDLDERLAPLVRRIRRACTLLVEQKAAGVREVRLRDDRLALESLPVLHRKVFEALAEAARPESVMADPRWEPHLVEQLLTDAIRRGAVEDVIDDTGASVLLAGGEPATADTTTERESDSNGDGDAEQQATSREAPPNEQPAVSGSSEPNTTHGKALDEVSDDVEVKAPSSLSEAIVQQATVAKVTTQAPIVDTKTLRPRPKTHSSPDDETKQASSKTGEPPRSEPPSGHSQNQASNDESSHEPSGSDPDDDPTGSERGVSEPEQAGEQQELRENEHDDESDEEAAPEEQHQSQAVSNEAETGDSEERSEADGAKSGEKGEGASNGKLVPWALGALLVGAAAGWFIYFGPGASSSSAPRSKAVAAPEASVRFQQPTVTTAADRTSRMGKRENETSQDTKDAARERSGQEKAGTSALDDPRIETGLPLDRGKELGTNVGVLEVLTGKRGARINVDKMDVGRGRHSTVVLEPGWHDVVVRRYGKTIKARAPVEVGKKTRLNLEGSW